MRCVFVKLLKKHSSYRPLIDCFDVFPIACKDTQSRRGKDLFQHYFRYVI